MSMGVEVVGTAAQALNESEPQAIRKTTLPASPEAASIVYNGSLLNVPNVIRALYGWMGSNGYTSAGSHREIHLFGRELEEFHGLTNEDFVQKNVVYEILVPIERF